MKKGHFFMIIGHSGVGKKLIQDKLIENIDNLFKIVSHTSRDKRPNEIEGEDYYFISKNEYLKMYKNKEFIMHYEYKPNNQFYGTSRVEVLSNIDKGKLIIDETDEYSVYDMVENNLLDRELFTSIYILPPKKEVLIERAKLRKEILPEELKFRLEHYDDRMKDFEKYKKYFNFIVDSSDFDFAYNEIKKIILKYN